MIGGDGVLGLLIIGGGVRFMMGLFFRGSVSNAKGPS